MAEVNLEKATGTDLCPGIVLKKEDILSKFVTQMTGFMNSRSFPDYMKESRLVLLSKTGEEATKPEDTRPIAILTIATKIAAKAILTKIKQMDLMKTGDYQTGFKEGMGTGKNIERMITRM